MILLMIVSLLLILVVLLQRGRGGGLAGAFGGMGGQSAFGTKAGDVFTRITIGLITVWVLLAGVSGVLARKYSNVFDNPGVEVSPDDPDAPAIPVGSGGGRDSNTGSSMGVVGTVPDDTPDPDKLDFDTQPAEETGVKPASTDDATSTDDPAASTDSDSPPDKSAADADAPVSESR
jgi:preprotein translocase subunit SecG